MSTPIITDYTILTRSHGSSRNDESYTHDAATNLTVTVRQHMKQGWVPLGPAAIAVGSNNIVIAAQTMVKYTKEE